MSEIAILVESVTGAGWMFLCAVGVVALGFLTLDRQPKSKSRANDEARPGVRRAA